MSVDTRSESQVLSASLVPLVGANKALTALSQSPKGESMAFSMQRSDQELVDATLAGELPAFDELMERYQRLVYSLVSSFANHTDEALDLTQNIFLKAYRKLSAFDGRGSLKAWLARIAINEGINTAKSATRRQARHEAWHIVRDDHHPAAQDHDVLVTERKQQVANALGHLSPRHRLAIELRYLQEMPIREVAAVLECSEGVARNILFRGLRKLRQELAEAS